MTRLKQGMKLQEAPSLSILFLIAQSSQKKKKNNKGYTLFCYSHQ